MDFKKQSDNLGFLVKSNTNYCKAILKMDISHFISDMNIQKNWGKCEEL